MYNRRNFLRLTSAAVLGGIAFSGSINVFGQKRENFPIPKTIFSQANFALNQQTFEPLVNTTFVFQGDNGLPVSLKLVEVATTDNTKKYSSQIPVDSFTLIFEVQDKAVLEDKIYQVSHSALSDFPMFISTVGKSGRRYQAVFNRVYV